MYHVSAHGIGERMINVQYIYIYTHTRTHVRTHAYIHARTHAHKYARTHTHTNACTHARVWKPRTEELKDSYNI